MIITMIFSTFQLHIFHKISFHYLEHLQQCSICDLALEMVDEVHQSNLVNSLKPLKVPTTSFQSPGGALDQSNEHQSNRIY